MSYPQPDSNAPVVNGQNFFRLHTPLVSPGDIYESQVGGGYFTLGPDSDIANVAIDYFDTSMAPTFMNSIAISNWSSVAGVIPAVNDRNYLPLNQVAGRILIRPTDVFNPAIDVTGLFAGVTPQDSCVIKPQLDVIQYFAQPPSVVPARRDKTYLFQSFTTAPSGRVASFLIPFYGRRFAGIQLANPLTNTINLWASLVSFAIGGGAAGSGSAAYNVGAPLATNVAVLTGTNYFLPVLPGDRGPCDALFIALSVPVQDGYGTGAMLKVIVSDRES